MIDQLHFHKKPYDTFHYAKLLNVHKLAAARVRMRYLDQRIAIALEDGSDVALHWAIQDLDEVCYLITKAYMTERKDNPNAITDDMIESARNFPIEHLIDFSRYGKALAFCHDDSKPTLSHYKAKNLARCFACNISFSPIDVLIKRDGMTFREAVKELCR